MTDTPRTDDDDDCKRCGGTVMCIDCGNRDVVTALRARVQELEAERPDLLRSRQLHDATCFTELGAQRQRAFELAMKVQELEREVERLIMRGHGYPTVNTKVFCAHCEHTFTECPTCGRDEWRIEKKP